MALRTLSDFEKARAALECLSLDRVESRDEWIRMGLALYSLGDPGLALWERWSRGSNKYREGECERKWRTMRPSRIGLGSLISAALEDNRDLYLALLREAEGGAPPPPGSMIGSMAAAAPPRPEPPLVPPGPVWQAAGRAFCAECQSRLWDEKTPDPLNWLLRRGLQRSTIYAAGLGWNPGKRYDLPEKWGLEPWVDERNGQERPGRVRIPKGWVFPWEIDADLWRIKIRLTPEELERQKAAAPPDRPFKPTKYLPVKGAANALYNGDSLSSDRPAVLTEGEIDALTVNQQAGDIVTGVALGGTMGARRRRWIEALAACPVVLVALDADPDPNKGDAAAAWWLQTLPNGRRLRPWWGDANAMHQAGADLWLWIAGGLGLQGAAPVKGEGRKR